MPGTVFLEPVLRPLVCVDRSARGAPDQYVRLRVFNRHAAFAGRLEKQPICYEADRCGRSIAAFGGESGLDPITIFFEKMRQLMD